MTRPYDLSAAVEASFRGSVADPGVIGINFTAGRHSIPESATGGAFWNNVGGDSGADISLRDAAGHPTSARLTFESSCAYAEFSAPKTPNRAVNRLYLGGLVGDDTRSEVVVSVDGLPFRVYDLFVFASADTANRSPLSITDGTTTFFYRSSGAANADARVLLRTVSESASAPTEGAAQFQRFTGRVEPTFTLTTGGSRNCVLSNNVFGLLIVQRASGTEPTPMPAKGPTGARSEVRVPFPPGATVRIRYRAGGGGALAIRAGDDIALHVNPRPHEGALVLNTLRRGAWGQEERLTGYPFDEGGELTLSVWAGPDGFHVQAGLGEGLPFCCRFGYRLPPDPPPDRITFDLEGVRAITVRPGL
jgi:hypothetical protein